MLSRGPLDAMDLLDHLVEDRRHLLVHGRWVLAFHDVRPVAPVHLLLIPKAHVPSLYECEPGHVPVLGKLLALAPRLAREQGATDGFRTIINTGRVGRQEVYHLHIHVIGGPAVLGPMIARQ